MSGVKDVIDTTCNMLSAVTNIPQTILFGRSPAGMNATGDSDLENYYNMVENIQKQNMKANARTVIDLILKQGLIEGKIPEIPKYKMKFAALWSLSDTEQADIAQKKATTEQTKAQTAQVYIDSGVLDPSEVRSSLATEGEFDIEEVITEDDLNLPEDTFSPTEMSGTSENDRLTRDPEINYSQNGNNTCIAKYTLAVDRRFKQDGGQEADFISCAVFGKGAEFAEKYLHKGTKIAITGRLETGSYTNKDGVKVYTTTVIVEEQEFAESKASSQNNAGGNYQQPASNNSSSGDGFMNVPDGIDEELPFV